VVGFRPVARAAAGAPVLVRSEDERNNGARPWLNELDAQLRNLFSMPSVEAFVGALVAQLITAPDKRLFPAELTKIYCAHAGPVLTKPLREFIDSQP